MTNTTGNFSTIFCAYGTTPNTRTVKFMGRPFTDNTAILDALFAGANAATNGVKKQAFIYASAKLGWTDIASSAELTAFEESERDELNATLTPPQRVIGVYESTDGGRRAWIIHTPSPFDPKGLMLVVR